MNSLNILVRSSSGTIPTLLPGASTSHEKEPLLANLDEQNGDDGLEHIDSDEKTPLLDKAEQSTKSTPKTKQGWKVHHRIAEFMINSVKVVIATICAPGRFLVACFYDDEGHFSTFMPIRRMGGLFTRPRRKPAPMPVPAPAEPKATLHEPKRRHTRQPSDSAISIASTSSSISDGEEKDEDTPARHTRSHSIRDGTGEHRRSIRIQVQEESLRRRTGARGSIKRAAGAYSDDVATVASALKSPSSSGKLTRYPRSPVPPRPLVPRRQPSYSLAFNPDPPKKTLIIDLDETLIHSMAKGGRMSQGHMVEVRLGAPVSSSGVSIGPGVPILYFVHERPGCHEFLRKVCRWYNLVVFTASVQEYADPVIDWLERERKYFSNRYYRQHCTFRNGAYIKDLAQVEPDLSKVMILDNSPMSYVFHEDNAIPIEGWISDPTDNDLLHLIPLLEGLQYVTDVRALLALRQGQAQQA
ncbi:hypothetical protein AMS68_002917 [Peltaster fructicola]|uniref:FCP1 homology domain-containing protein n=1 Tax=Peltaster fructicola TaxID=286661 RepID=A0A6H0XSF3_9PEZI|nr:hypothetical protein AMS68_002917 [Peltaster fructicola]